MNRGLDALIPAFGTILGLGTVMVLIRRPQPGARALAAVLAAGVWWTLCAALEMTAGSLEVAVFWSRMAAFGIAALGPLWILFCWHYSTPERPFSLRGWGLFWVLPLVYIFLVWTNRYHGWVWPQVEWVAEMGRCRFGHGPAKWGMAFYTYALFIVGGLRLFATVRRSSSAYCAQTLLLLTAAGIPILANFLYLIRWTPWPEMDVTPVAISVSGMVIAFALFRRRSFDLFPLARSLVFDQMEDGVLVLDTRNRILDMNPSAVRLLGDTRAPSLGDSIPITGSERVGFAAMDWQRLLGEGSVETKTEEGRVLEARCSPIRGWEGRILGRVILLRDVTAVREEARQRVAVENRLREAEKMEAVGRLAGGVAHDFNNMLQAISGFTEILLLDTPESDPKRQELLEIQKATQRARDLTRQLLAFSRKQMLKPCILDLNDLIRQLVKMLARLLGEDIRIEMQLTPDLWPVRADPSQIEQALMNLCINARDAMPEGGTLTLTTGHAVYDESSAAERGGEVRAGRFVVVSVSDTGTGLSPEAAAHLFEPFFTTKRGRGTGMGLATLYGIVKQHEGFIHVYSEPQHGCTFRIYLPAVEKAEGEQGTKAMSVDSSLRGAGERILLIEDEMLIRQMTERALRLNGYEVESAASAAEAIRLFESAPFSWDLVFSDVILPDGNGLELVERFSVINPRLAVVLTSGFSDEKSRWPDIARRQIAFLQKPWNVPELLRTLREVLSRNLDKGHPRDQASQGR